VYRAYSFRNASDCPGGDDGSDPMNVLVWENGAWSRIDDHFAGETHWGFSDGSANQYLCARTSNTGAYNVAKANMNEEDGHVDHTVLFGRKRTHFRIWGAPHNHDDNVDKWATLTVHHEDNGEVVGGVDHIDEDWEAWENHLVNEMDPHHVVYRDVYYHRPAVDWRGFMDNGLVSRIGGLHDGCYSCGPTLP
jgi:hypothetical protein